MQRVKWSISVRHLPVSAKVGFFDHADKAILLKVFPYLNANWDENWKRGTELCTLYRLHYFLHESVQSFTQYNIFTAYPLSHHGELSGDFAKLWRRRRRQRQRQKAIDLVSKTTTLHFIMLFCAFLCHLCTTTTWNFKLFWGRERQGDKLYHLCLNSDAAPPFSSNINSLLLSTWRLGIIAKWFERMRRLFFSEVFMDVAVVRS